MNARQIKKKAKQAYYVGLFEGFVQKLQENTTSDSILINIVPVGFGHNQHHYAKIAKFGKILFKKYKQ